MNQFKIIKISLNLIKFNLLNKILKYLKLKRLAENMIINQMEILINIKVKLILKYLMKIKYSYKEKTLKKESLKLELIIL